MVRLPGSLQLLNPTEVFADIVTEHGYVHLRVQQG